VGGDWIQLAQGRSQGWLFEHDYEPYASIQGVVDFMTNSAWNYIEWFN